MPHYRSYADQAGKAMALLALEVVRVALQVHPLTATDVPKAIDIDLEDVLEVGSQ